MSSERDHDTVDSPNPARLDEAFKGLRDLNRREHDWLARDIEDLQKDFMALRERMAEVEPQLAEVIRIQSQAERTRDKRQTNWPQWAIAGAAVIATLVSLWTVQHPPAPPVETIVAAIEAYQAEHPGARR
ncbi:MAG TPA: hypothetical protein VMB50_20900 [Myxococcales bacterium]|nr:hypothetical protein [Myxococcales bacterium]